MFDPWSGKLPHAAGQLSPHATATEPALRASELQQEKPLQWEVHTLQPEGSSSSPQLEKAQAAAETQNSQEWTGK